MLGHSFQRSLFFAIGCYKWQNFRWIHIPGNKIHEVQNHQPWLNKPRNWGLESIAVLFPALTFFSWYLLFPSIGDGKKRPLVRLLGKFYFLEFSYRLSVLAPMYREKCLNKIIKKGFFLSLKITNFIKFHTHVQYNSKTYTILQNLEEHF